MTQKTTYKQPNVIAEIGCNHRGEMETARELIKIARLSIHHLFGQFCRNIIDTDAPEGFDKARFKLAIKKRINLDTFQ